MAELVVLASGSGSNFEAIARRVRTTHHRLTALITNTPDAYAIRRAESIGVPWIVVDYASGRSAAEAQLLDLLTTLDPDLIALAGFMKVLPPPIVDAFASAIYNIHPSLLPDFAGLNAIERSWNSGASRLGITIHYVDAGIDTGTVIEQHSFAREEVSSLEEAEARIHALEHSHYPRVLCEALDRPGDRRSAM
ncbi:MAG: phosphoribosylglycinamide formyltransferase [Spirochaetaceae bacterium]|nr:MAG: phosphoribosylglycinamide formyltransferase [Spirochaetaceae bacterium]